MTNNETTFIKCSECKGDKSSASLWDWIFEYPGVCCDESQRNTKAMLMRMHDDFINKLIGVKT